MTRDEFLDKYIALRDAQLDLCARDLCERVIADARQIEVETSILERFYDTHEAAPLCGRSSKTIANMCAGGVFPGAKKSSPGKGGKWLIPGCDIRALQQQRQHDTTKARQTEAVLSPGERMVRQLPIIS